MTEREVEAGRTTRAELVAYAREHGLLDRESELHRGSGPAAFTVLAAVRCGCRGRVSGSRLVRR